MLTIADIQARVAQHYGLSREDMRGRSLVPCLAHPRQVGMFLARRLTDKSRAQIGRVFDRDKSTVYFAVAAVAERRATNMVLDADIRAIEAELLA